MKPKPSLDSIFTDAAPPPPAFLPHSISQLNRVCVELRRPKKKKFILAHLLEVGESKEQSQVFMIASLQFQNK